MAKVMKRKVMKTCALVISATVFFAVFAISVRLPGQSPPIATATPDFVKDIQPIFVQSCYGCHGAKTQMAGMRLDSREIVVGKEIKPGDAAASELYQRVAGLGEHARMPLGGKLEPAQIDLIKRWIDAGAVWPNSADVTSAQIKTHWAFVPPVRPPVPAVTNPNWPKNPIDNFILARLEKEGLTPSPEADGATLLRRLSLDLIGLPPTPEEIDSFLHDGSPDAYEKQVDRLLNSAHYGERWGRIWLDGARYADSDGFEKDKQRQVWAYRDWVVNALNRNLPYDQFVIDQIAGDELPYPTQDQLVATGFLRNSMTNEEGGIDPEQFRMEAMFDRMDAVGKNILGITIQCAQCHTHKFDPIKHDEYYRMFAYLNDFNEATMPVYSPAELMKKADLFRQIREIEGTLQHHNPNWEKRMAEWEDKVKADQPEWIIVRPAVDDISTGGQKYTPLDDGSFLAQGYAPGGHTVKMTVKTDVRDIAAFRLELLTDSNLPMNGPGRSYRGLCALTEFNVEAAPASDPTKTTPVKIVRATADFGQAEAQLDPDDKSAKPRIIGPVQFAIDGDALTAWGIDAGPGQRNQARKAVFNAEKPIYYDGGEVLTFLLAQKHGGFERDENHVFNLGRFRLSVTTAPDAVADPLPANIRKILAIPRADRTPDQQWTVFSFWRTTVPDWKESNDHIEALRREYPEGASQLVVSDREKLRPTHVLTRGDFLKPAEVATPGVPAFLNPLPAGAPPTRLSFAKWMVASDSPTSARSYVNRQWQAWFGTGIVATTENLGTQSEPPTHPELLDWLAVEFMQSGWNIKHMQRLIATSAVYRQVSNVTPELLDKDPYNRLLARGPRFRVDAEIVRDVALSASGLLNPAIGGPSVYPPAPAFLFVPPASYSPKIWTEDKGPERYRRAIYTFRYRSVPYPMLQTFDAPNGDSSCVRRARSNTPLQALTMLNEPLFMECARALAAKTLSEGGTTNQQRLVFAFRRCLGRQPTEGESVQLLEFLDKQQGRLRDGWLSALDLAGLSGKDDKQIQALAPKGATPVDFAAWTAVSRVLLNLDETITTE
jgi:mono/diheme cytochrome c family protein